MAQFFVFLVACLLVNLALAQRPQAALGVAGVLLLAVPSFNSAALTGIPYFKGGAVPALMPVTWFVFIMFFVQLQTSAINFSAAWRRHSTVFGLALFVVVWSFGITFTHSGAGFSQLLEVLVGPLLAGWLILSQLDGSGVEKARKWVYWAALIEAGIAQLEYVAGHSLLYERQFANEGLIRFQQTHEFRSAATLDHPLNLALLLVVGLGCAAGITSTSRRLACQLVMFGGLATTGSRAGVALGFLVLLLAQRGLAIHTRIAIRAVIILAAGGVLFESQLGTLIAGRIANDSGSGAVRFQALSAFKPFLHEYYFTGTGIGSSFSLSYSLTSSANSFENPLVMYTVDIGMAVTVVFFGVLLATAVGRAAPGLRITALAALGMVLTYSSISTKGSTTYVLFIALFLARASADASSKPLSPSTPVQDKTIPVGPGTRLQLNRYQPSGGQRLTV